MDRDKFTIGAGHGSIDSGRVHGYIWIVAGLHGYMDIGQVYMAIRIREAL